MNSNKCRVLVVDDERLARRGICQLLSAHPWVEETLEASDGVQAVELIRTEQPHVVFLDVQMPEMDGFAVVRQLDSRCMPPVVFVTAHDRYAIQAFEISAIDYLLKPVSRVRFDQTLQRVRERVTTGASQDERVISLLEAVSSPSKYLKRLAVRSGGKTVFVDVLDINWIQAAENYVQVHTSSGRHLVHVPIQTMQGTLDPQEFLRIHRSVIVNVRQVKELEPTAYGEYMFVLRCGARLRSGRSYHGVVKQWASNPF